MPSSSHVRLLAIPLILSCITGCSITHNRDSIQALRPVNTPRELCKSTLPQYRIEPPDILNVSVVRMVPNGAYRFNTSDLLRITVTRNSLSDLIVGDLISVRVPGAPALSAIDGNFLIQPDGTISLGTPYGSVKVAGMTLEEAAKKIEESLSESLVAAETYVSLAQAGLPVDGEFTVEIDGTIDFGHPYGRVTIDGLGVTEAREMLTKHFARFFELPTVTLNLVQSSAFQSIVGEHLVGPDGYVSLGSYGSVRVVGMTLDEANVAIADVLSNVLDEPKVATSVLAYNSKIFYIITQGAGVGDGVFRFPITGNETVLDALSLINGFPQGSSTEMWIARPSHSNNCHQVLPVDWHRVTSLAETHTNYQLLPGDRLYIRRDPFTTFDTKLAKFTSPLERILGFSILGAQSATRLSGKVLSGGGNPIGQRF